MLMLQIYDNATNSYNLIHNLITGMISESERRVRILDYVRQNSDNPKVTKSDVMRHMKDFSRAMTTHKTTIELIKEGKIKMVKPPDKPYSQTDYLVINEDNEFNKMYDILTEFEGIMIKMDKTMDKIRTTLNKFQKDREHVEFVCAIAIDGALMDHYRHIFENLLQNTLIRISRSMLSENDRQLLTYLVIGLLNKLSDTYRYYRERRDIHPALKEDIEMMKAYYTMSNDSKDLAEKYGIDLKIIDELASIIEKSKDINII